MEKDDKLGRPQPHAELTSIFNNMLLEIEVFFIYHPRSALLRAQVKGAEEQSKILEEHAKGATTGGSADVLLRMMNSGHLSELQTISVRDELFKLSGNKW